MEIAPISKWSQTPAAKVSQARPLASDFFTVYAAYNANALVCHRSISKG